MSCASQRLLRTLLLRLRYLCPTRLPQRAMALQNYKEPALCWSTAMTFSFLLLSFRFLDLTLFHSQHKTQIFANVGVGAVSLGVTVCGRDGDQNILRVLPLPFLLSRVCACVFLMGFIFFRTVHALAGRFIFCYPLFFLFFFLVASFWVRVSVGT